MSPRPRREHGRLFSLGTWLLLQRSLTRIIIGLACSGTGRTSAAPLGPGSGGRALIGGTGRSRPADPMPRPRPHGHRDPFGVSAFLALAYRSWQLTGDDLVEGRRGSPASPGRARTTTKKGSSTRRPSSRPR